MHVEHSETELELLVARIDRHELDHRPDRQHGQAWDQDRQQRLIDTILRNWSVPPVHIAEGGSVGSEVVLDGGQRLHAIARFFHDELPCSEAVPLGRDDTTRVEGMHFSDLPTEVRRRVRRFRLTVVTLSNYQAAELYELLDRLEQPAQPPPPEVPAPRAGGSPNAPRRTVTHRAEGSLEPIYDQVSAWFADLSEFDRLSQSVDGPLPPRWSSPADPGRAAAEAARHAGSGPVTDAGLPQREPQAQLVPGAIDPDGGVFSSNAPASRPDAEDVSERLASYQHGVDEGRQDRVTPAAKGEDTIGPVHHPIFGTEDDL